MLIELDSEQRASVRKLFDHYPCCHGSIAAAIEEDMGKVFVNVRANPQVVLAVLDFQFLAGDPSHENAPLPAHLL